MNLPLDDSLYSLEGENLAFFKEQTGITNEEELKKHILGAQKKAYDVCTIFREEMQSISTFVIDQLTNSAGL